MFLIIRLTS